MPTIIADTNDNNIFRSVTTGNFNDARDHSTGILNSATSTTVVIGQASSLNNRGGGTRHFVSRGFFYFDTTDVTGTLSDATLKLQRDSNSATNPSLIIVKATAFGGDGQTALATTDFKAISGWQDNTSLAGLATDYSSVITSLNPNTTIQITLNAAALADIKNNDAFIICAMQYSKDYLNVDPGSPVSINSNSLVRSVDTNFNAIFRPQLVYNLAPTGYGNDVSGVASNNIGKVNEVETANIEKVIGV